MRLQHIPLLILICVVATHAQPDVPAEQLKELKRAHKESRAKLSAKWASNQPELEDVLCAKPASVGHVTKNPRVQDSPTVALSRPAIEQLKDSGVPVYTACQVYVSDTWKFIFMRNPKASSTAILAAIKNQLCGGTCSEEQFTRVRLMSQLEPKWESYFVFTVVRNPWLRSLSAYTMFTDNFLRRCDPAPSYPSAMGWHETPQPGPMEKCGLPFDKYAEDAYNMRAICEGEACCAHIPARGFVPGLVDAHIADQAHCVFLPSGEPLVDYIGTAEDLDQAWTDIVAAINERAGTAFEAQSVKNPNGRGPEDAGGVRHTCNGENVLSTMTREAAYSIARQYAHDVQSLGYMVIE